VTAVTCRRLFLRSRKGASGDAQVYGTSSGDVALEAETGFYLALDAFGYRELDAARTWCLRSLDGAANARSFSVTGGNIPLQHVQARTHELLGLIEAAEGKDVDWLAEALKALFALTNAPSLMSTWKRSCSVISAFSRPTLIFRTTPVHSRIASHCSHGPRMSHACSSRRSKLSDGLQHCAATSLKRFDWSAGPRPLRRPHRSESSWASTVR